MRIKFAHGSQSTPNTILAQPGTKMNSLPIIIVVEDDVGLTHLIQNTLQKKDFQTNCSLSGRVIIENAVDIENSIILLDYELEDMTGKQFI